MKTQLTEKFNFMRDDRAALFKKVDNIDFEVEQYRKDIISYKKDIGRTFNQRLNILDREDEKIGQQFELLKSTLHGMRLLIDKTISTEVSEIYSKTESISFMVEKQEKIVYDLRLKSVEQELFDEKIFLLEREIDWLKKDKSKYDVKLKSLETYIQVYLPIQTKLHIDERLTVVIGDRKKYAKRIKETMKNYQEELS